MGGPKTEAGKAAKRARLQEEREKRAAQAEELRARAEQAEQEQLAKFLANETTPPLPLDALSITDLLSIRQAALTLLYPYSHSLDPLPSSALDVDQRTRLQELLQKLRNGCEALEP
jgi:hypothetical protein